MGTRFLVGMVIAAEVSFMDLGVWAEASNGETIVSLKANEPRIGDGKSYSGLLRREIVRQGVLLAARDELGAATRDETLDEPLLHGKAPDHILLDIDTQIRTEDYHVKIEEIANGNSNVLFEKTFPLKSGGHIDAYQELVRSMERNSREVYPGVLRRAGGQEKRRNGTSRVKVPLPVIRLVTHLNFLSQYQALRALHRLSRENGESLDVLAGLARAYVNLGQLTMFHWNASNKVFLARALLYAERMRVKYPNDPEALRHLAYVYTLSGFHRVALSFLQEYQKALEARKAASGKRSRSQYREREVALLSAYCRYDIKALAEAAGGPRMQSQLAGLLYFLSVEFAKSPTQKRTVGATVVQSMPECFRIHDGMCDAGGLGNLHMATVMGPRALSATLHAHLKAMNGLPGPVLDRIQKGVRGKEPEPQSRPVIMRMLFQAAESPGAGEPSWAVLGSMLRNLSFVQVYRRVNFIRYMLGLPWSDIREYVQQTEPLVADHPYHNFIRASLVSGANEKQQIEGLLGDMKIRDVSTHMRALTFLLWAIKRNGMSRGETKFRQMYLHCDFTANELERLNSMCWSWRQHVGGIAARLLSQVSPYNPVPIAFRIKTDWPSAAPHAREWEEKFGQHYCVISELAKHYTDAHKNEDAKRCLTKTISLAQDKWLYESLADIYQEEGDREKWKGTLDRYLQTEESGLDHARVQVKIANYYMSVNDYQRALPYAAAAAETWAAWAMECAYRCYEGLHNWQKAEVWVSRISERYDGRSRLDWFHWCHRTGRGHPKEALKVAERYVQECAGNATASNEFEIGILYQFAGQLKRAYDHFQASYEINRNAWSGHQIMVMANQFNDPGTVNKILERMVVDFDQARRDGRKLVALFDLADLFQEGHKRGGKLDRNRLEELLKGETIIDQTNLLYFTGSFFVREKEEPSATEFMRRAYSTGNEIRAAYSWQLARDWLRERKVPVTSPAKAPAAAPSKAPAAVPADF